MMTDASMTFTVTFHSRFRVGADSGRDGIDIAVDHDVPLHGDHLKGVMRAQADVLRSCGALGPHGDAITDATFGTSRASSNWTWTPAQPSEDWAYTVRHRVMVDAKTHAAVKDHIVRAEAVWSPQATFTIEWIGAGKPNADQAALLRVCAASVHHIGGWRRRGLGWVGITTDGDRTTDLTTLRGAV